MENTTALQRPPKVTMAVYLLILSILIGLASGITRLLAKNYPELHPSLWDWIGYISLIVFILAIIVIYFFIFYRMSRGVKWARTVMLVLVCLGAGMDVVEFILYRTYLGNTYNLIGGGLSAIAVILLYTREANTWYNNKNIPSRGE